MAPSAGFRSNSRAKSRANSRANSGAKSRASKKSVELPPPCRGPSSFGADGQLVGKDPFGNMYYEIPADPRSEMEATVWNLLSAS